jgi:hypothetical protein
MALSAISGIQDQFLTKAQLDKKYENEKGKVYRELMDKMSGKQPVSKDANGRSSRGIRVSDKGNKRDYVSAPTGSQEYNDNRQKQIEAEKQRLRNVGNSPARSTSSSSSSSRGSSSPARMPASVTRSSTPKAQATPAKPGQKWDDFNPNRGTSKSNNPLLDRDKGGIKLRDRMKERENRGGMKNFNTDVDVKADSPKSEDYSKANTSNQTSTAYRLNKLMGDKKKKKGY